MRKRIENVLGYSQVFSHLSLTKTAMLQMALAIENYRPLKLRQLTTIVYGLDSFSACPNYFAKAKSMFNETVDEVLKVLPDYKGADIEVFAATTLLLKLYLLNPDLADGSNLEKVLEEVEKIQKN